MTDDQQKIIEKIAKIKAHAESAETIGNEAEALAFSEMMQRLLLKHKLSMTDLEYAKLEKEEPVGPYEIDFKKHGVKYKKTRIDWAEKLASIIAKAHFCRIVVHSGSSHITLIGRASDAAVAEWMIVTLQRSLDRMSYLAAGAFNRQCHRENRVGDHHGFRRAFIIGFVARLAKRYEDEVKAQEGSSSTALVRISKAMVAVEDYMKKQREAGIFSKSSALQRRFTPNEEGFKQGISAANSINLKGRALEGGIPNAVPKGLRS